MLVNGSVRRKLHDLPPISGEDTLRAARQMLHYKKQLLDGVCPLWLSLLRYEAHARLAEMLHAFERQGAWRETTCHWKIIALPKKRARHIAFLGWSPSTFNRPLGFVGRHRWRRRLLSSADCGYWSRSRIMSRASWHWNFSKAWLKTLVITICLWPSCPALAFQPVWSNLLVSAMVMAETMECPPGRWCVRAWDWNHIRCFANWC